MSLPYSLVYLQVDSLIGNEISREECISICETVNEKIMRAFHDEATSHPQKAVAIAMGLYSSATDCLTGTITAYGGEEYSDELIVELNKYMDKVKDVLNRISAKNESGENN